MQGWSNLAQPQAQSVPTSLSRAVLELHFRKEQLLIIPKQSKEIVTKCQVCHTADNLDLDFQEIVTKYQVFYTADKLDLDF